MVGHQPGSHEYRCGRTRRHYIDRGSGRGKGGAFDCRSGTGGARRNPAFFQKDRTAARSAAQRARGEFAESAGFDSGHASPCPSAGSGQKLHCFSAGGWKNAKNRLPLPAVPRRPESRGEVAGRQNQITGSGTRRPRRHHLAHPGVRKKSQHGVLGAENEDVGSP